MEKKFKRIGKCYNQLETRHLNFKLLKWRFLAQKNINLIL